MSDSSLSQLSSMPSGSSSGKSFSPIMGDLKISRVQVPSEWILLFHLPGLKWFDLYNKTLYIFTIRVSRKVFKCLKLGQFHLVATSSPRKLPHQPRQCVQYLKSTQPASKNNPTRLKQNSLGLRKLNFIIYLRFYEKIIV